MKVVKFLRQILRWIQSRFPNAARIINFLRCNTVSTYLFRIFIQKNAAGSCTEPQIAARSFFKENEERVNELASWFIDDHSRDVFFRMIEYRCNPDIARLPKSDAKTQYFYNEYFTYGDDEVFVDCGAYTGDTVARFKKAMKHGGGNWKKIVAFEPDGRNYGDLKKLHKDVTAINTGVWVKSDSLCFSNIGTNATHILHSEIDNAELHSSVAIIPVRAIDECPECEGVTFLKMDIEGAELPALKGAYNTIAKYKPRLAICIYHSDEEMVTIPEWVRENFPEYKLFVRHHNKYCAAETVMYGFV